MKKKVIKFEYNIKSVQSVLLFICWVFIVTAVF